MYHDILKRIILEQHEIIKNMHIIQRDNEIEGRSNRILVGLRRAGKTTMLYRLVLSLVKNGIDWHQIIYINFEDERLDGFSSDDFDDILAVKAELTDNEGWFFFDEIQNVSLWEKFCRRLADSKLHVFVTGSNARMLSREMESVLGGRFLSTLVFPYSFREYLEAERIPHDRDAMLKTTSSARILRAFDEYLHFGGFPENTGRSNRREYVSSVYRKVLEGDIIARREIRNPVSLRLMVKKIAESVKDPISYNRISATMRGMGVSMNPQTAIDYMSYMEEAYLIFPVRNWFSPFSERESVRKHYFTDTGILSLFLVDRDPVLLENLVASELYRRHPTDLEESVAFVKSAKTELDIDFYLPAEQTLIQVSYSLDQNSREREMNALVKAARLMPEVQRFLILTSNEDRTIEARDISIEVMPVWRWLLEC